MEIDLRKEVRRTNPDYIVFAPHDERGHRDWGNELVSVLETQKGELLAFWVQTSAEGYEDARYVVARSVNHGVTWTPPAVIAGSTFDPVTSAGKTIGGQVFMNASGRIYAVYNKTTGIYDESRENGNMYMIFSDDDAHTWSIEYRIAMPRSKWDSDDENIPPSWTIFAPPVRLSNGSFICGLLHWVADDKQKKMSHWTFRESVCNVIIFEDVDSNPDPSCMKITFAAWNDDAFKAPHRADSGVCVAQEPTFVELPNGEIFSVYRTNDGCPYYTVSGDYGITWSRGKPLFYKDGGQRIKHPLSPCPMYRISDGEYIFFIHNHDGNFGPWSYLETGMHRRPVFIVRGEYESGSEQRIVFSEPMEFLDNGGIPIGLQPRCDLALYGSFTHYADEYVLWYPDRKFFICGKRIDMEKFRALRMI